MSRFSTSRAVRLVAVVTALVVPGAAIFAVSRAWQKSAGGASAGVRTANSVGAISTARGVADALDGLLQARFADSSEGKFGLSRMPVPVMSNHPTVRLYGGGMTPSEQIVINSVRQTGRAYSARFLRTAMPPATPTVRPRRFAVPMAVGALVEVAASKKRWADKARQAQWRTWAAANVARLNTRQAVEGSVGDWSAFASPVVARDATCLSCHSSNRVGDTLGALVYFVQDRPAVAAPRG